jgi:hypothetical protein
MDVLARINPNVDRLAVLPHILKVMYAGKMMPSEFSFFHISLNMVRSAVLLSFESCLPAEGYQHSTLYFSLAINVILLPLTTWIKHIRVCLVVLAIQRGFDCSAVILF